MHERGQRLGDVFQTVVDVEASAAEADLLAAEVLAWLVGRGIVMPERAGWVPGGTGYAPGPNFHVAVAQPYEQTRPESVDGLNVVTGRTASTPWKSTGSSARTAEAPSLTALTTSTGPASPAAWTVGTPEALTLHAARTAAGRPVSTIGSGVLPGALAISASSSGAGRHCTATSSPPSPASSGTGSSPRTESSEAAPKGAAPARGSPSARPSLGPCAGLARGRGRICRGLPAGQAARDQVARTARGPGGELSSSSKTRAGRGTVRVDPASARRSPCLGAPRIQTSGRGRPDPRAE